LKGARDAVDEASREYTNFDAGAEAAIANNLSSFIEEECGLVITLAP
jgi:hypothetical protein